MYDRAEIPQDIDSLKKEIRELTRLLESSQDVFYRTDLQGRLTFVTPSIERYAGYSPAELIGRFAHEVYADPEDRSKLVEELHRSGSVIDYGVRLVDRSGKIHFVSVNARVISEEGVFAGVEGVMRDITRRKTLELAVEDSEHRFRTLTELAPVGIFLSDLDGDCLFVNPKWCELAGLSIDEARGKGWQKAIHPDDRERVIGERNAAGAVRRGFEIEFRFQTPVGKTSFLLAEATVLNDADGKFAGYVGTVTDLTNIRHAEQVTRNLGSIVESFQDAVVVLTLEGIVLNWNKGAERIYGYEANEVVGRHMDLLYLTASQWQEVRGILDRLLSGQRSEPIVATRKRKDGATIHVSITFSLVLDIKGQPIGATSVSRDITERKLRQDAVQRSEEIFHAVFDRGAIGIAMIDADLRFERVNPLLARMLGRSEGELAGMKVSDVTHADDAEKGSRLALSLFRNEIPYYSFEKRYIHKNGHIIWVRLTATSIPDSDGKPALGLAMIEDISEGKKYEWEREGIIAQLQDALASVKTLSGLLPMCSWCKKIRDDQGAWSEVEVYVKQRSNADFTQGICPDCQNKVRKGFWMGSKDKTDKDPRKR
jgi:PAS domain S-box-containing protein